jgi:hypothetical protein
MIGVAAAAVTGCGSTSGPASGARPTACAPARPAATATVVARDDFFDPVCLDVPPGSVTLVVRNEGLHPHNHTRVDEAHAHVAVDAGQAGFVTATVGSSDVAFSCTIHPDMRGVLRVDRHPG